LNCAAKFISTDFDFPMKKGFLVGNQEYFVDKQNFANFCISSEKLQLQQTLMMIDMHALFINYHRFACSVLNSMTIKKYKR